MRYLSVCSGIEAATAAWHPLGWTPAAFAEIEKFPRAVLAHHYPDVPLHGDFTTIGADDYGPVNLLVGGTPCFSYDTLVVTRRRLVPISEIVIGDYVLTHKNRYRKVLSIGSKQAETIVLSGQGQSSGIITTNTHPFYSRIRSQIWVGRENGSVKPHFTAPEWTHASEMVGKMWASPASWPKRKAPKMSIVGRECPPPEMSGALAWIIGRWIGDGWCRINKRRGYAIICCGKSESIELANKIADSGFHASQSEERTTIRFQIANRSFARWLYKNFGAGAGNKTMSTWVFGWTHRSSLLEGYLSADGCKTKQGYSLTTISKCLALSIVLLAHTLGKSASRRLVHVNRNLEIEGRPVNEQPFWQIRIYDRARSSVEIDGHRWGRVRRIASNDGISNVFNLEVDGDNSYVADGIVVHNCQSFSIAGLRGGLDDDRGNLALEFLRLAGRKRPEWLLWENVPGVLSSNGGRDFGSILGGFRELGYEFAWRVLDAQYFGVAQRRRRVFIVGYLGDWRRAAAVLFERQSLCGDSPPRRETGKEVTGTLVSRTSGGGGGPEQGDGASENFVIATHAPDIAKCLVGDQGKQDSEVETFIPVAFSCKDNGRDVAVDMAPTLRAMNHTTSHQNGGGQLAVAFTQNQAGDVLAGDVSPSMGTNQNATGRNTPKVMVDMAVRRLTPRECERLQGFQDNFTLIPWRGKDAENCPDGPRYKALGNSMAVPCMSWIGERIDMVSKLEHVRLTACSI